MKILLATAELHPVVAVGGLAQAAAGLVRELRAQGVVVSPRERIGLDAEEDARFARSEGGIVVVAKGELDGTSG